MLDIAIAITNRILEELKKPRKQQDWEKNNLNALWKEAIKELSNQN